MLDVSLRADVLNLLSNLRVERGLSLLYITHDLLSARVVTDEILVLHHGRIVERGVTKDVLQNPNDDYTAASRRGRQPIRTRTTSCLTVAQTAGGH